MALGRKAFATGIAVHHPLSDRCGGVRGDRLFFRSDADLAVDEDSVLVVASQFAFEFVGIDGHFPGRPSHRFRIEAAGGVAVDHHEAI